MLTFIILAAAALGYRRRPAVHKRLMLFASISLMVAPIAHLGGHGGDSFMGMAIGLFASQALQAFVIGPSAAWHRFAEWMSQ